VKKIRVVQFGVGPIGASIARLMRQKATLEIVGAIDKDPVQGWPPTSVKLDWRAGCALGNRPFLPMRGPRWESPWISSFTPLRPYLRA